jgi:hypothetical protein
MSPLGKPLVFYLKYMAEMEYLYCDHGEGDEPDLTGLDDAGHVREMARIVGDAASNHVADFLELCGRRIEDHCNGIGATLSGKRRRADQLRDWCWYAQVHVPPPVPRHGCFSFGVVVKGPRDVCIALGQDVCGVVVPYLWVKGGRKGANLVWKVVGSWADSRSGEGLVYDTGTIALARIPIKAQPPKSFDVDRDQLIAEVMKIIARIGTKETKAIAKLVAGLKELVES